MSEDYRDLEADAKAAYEQHDANGLVLESTKAAYEAAQTAFAKSYNIGATAAARLNSAKKVTETITETKDRLRKLMDEAGTQGWFVVPFADGRAGAVTVDQMRHVEALAACEDMERKIKKQTAEERVKIVEHENQVLLFKLQQCQSIPPADPEIVAQALAEHRRGESISTEEFLKEIQERVDRKERGE